MNFSVVWSSIPGRISLIERCNQIFRLLHRTRSQNPFPSHSTIYVTYTGYRTCPTIRELKGYIAKFVSAAGAASPRVSCHTIRFRWKTKSKHDWISTRSATLQIQCISSYFGKVWGGSKIKRENMLAEKSRSPPVTHLQYEIVMVCLVNTVQFKQYTFSEQIHRQT